MATVGARKPKPKKSQAKPRAKVSSRGGKAPAMKATRNWVAGHVRAASYSRGTAWRMMLTGAAGFTFILIMGLWLGGFLPDVRKAGSDFTRARLMSMGFVVEQIDVVGEGRIREDEVRSALGVSLGGYLFETDMRQAQVNVQRLSWVDDAMVRRLWPNRIVVHIIEREPVALWQQDGHVSVVDSDGLIIEAAQAADFADLPLVVGKNAATQAQGIYNALLSSPEVSKRLQAIIRVGERRWDIALRGNAPRLMLPENGVAGALERIEAMQASHQILDLNLESIDLRMKGRAVMRSRESSYKTVRGGGVIFGKGAA